MSGVGRNVGYRGPGRNAAVRSPPIHQWKSQSLAVNVDDTKHERATGKAKAREDLGVIFDTKSVNCIKN